MTIKKTVETSNLLEGSAEFLKKVKEYALTLNEECPEAHRRDPRSGACLPMGSIDHTAFTRSLNDDQGDMWRGLKDKQDKTFGSEENKEAALLDANEMDEPVSCPVGTVFSFLTRTCVSPEQAEAENNEGFARNEAGEEVYEEGQNGHEDVIALDPEGRKDTPGFDCPPDQMFDFNLRECIPLNKDTVLAAEAQAGVAQETAAPITTKQRKGLSDSTFGVPGKRKFPLDTCARVRNAMARFNQAKGLTAGEKATLRRKILAAAGKCGIKVNNFAKATTAAEFEEVLREMMPTEKRVRETYEEESAFPFQKKDGDKKGGKGPCPPWMEWDPKAKKCTKAKGFIRSVLEQANHSDIIALDPAGRKDTPGFKCQDGYFFDFNLRKCIPLDPSKKMGTQPGDTTKASEDASQNDLVPNPAGKPAKLPSDCPAGTLWDKKLERCLPLDSRKKVASVDETAGREGLTADPAGKVKLPMDCPEGTIWDGTRRSCTPLDPSDKIRQGSPGPNDPKDLANVENMSVAQLISHLDKIIQADPKKERSKVEARDLPNEAFPPSLVASSRRSLMHHNPEVTDPYDHKTVDVTRLRNALARANKVEGYSPKAVEEAVNHLVEHAREVVKVFLGKN